MATKLREYLRLPNHMTQGGFGVEVEMEGKYLQPYVPHWFSGVDGSLRGSYRIEWSLKNPLNLEAAISAINFLYQYNISGGALLDPSERCASHIHFNVLDLSLPQISVLMAGWYVIERSMLFINNREENCFSRAMYQYPVGPEVVFKSLNKNLILNLDLYEVKYAALNLYNIFTLGSLEYRFLTTQDTPENLIKSLLFLSDFNLSLLNKYNRGVQLIKDLSQDYNVSDWLVNLLGDIPVYLFNPDCDEERVRHLLHQGMNDVILNFCG